MCYNINPVTEFSQDSVCYVQYLFILIGILSYWTSLNTFAIFIILRLQRISLRYLTTMKINSFFKKSSGSLIFDGTSKLGWFLKAVSSCPFLQWNKYKTCASKISIDINCGILKNNVMGKIQISLKSVCLLMVILVAVCRHFWRFSKCILFIAYSASHLTHVTVILY